MKKPPRIELDATQVDLGDDLMQTRTLIRNEADAAVSAPPAVVVESSDELVVNAKILRGEGLIDEAKRTLHRSLIRDPGHLPSRQLLDLIHADEMKELLRSGETKRRGRARAKSPLETDESPAEILRRLETDLEISPVTADPFLTESDRLEFARDLERLAQGASAEDRIDLGIAFQEMGLLALARVQFEIAQRDSETERKASLLLAQLLLTQGEAFQALLLLDPWVSDPSHGPKEKLEVGYLMARAYEDLQRWPEACLWYRGVNEIDDEYRDSLERFQRCERIRSSSSR